MNEDRFLTADSLNPDGTNRLDALGRNELPQHVAFVSRDIRRLLRESFAECMPHCPEDLHAVEDLFRAAFSVVSERWASERLQSLLGRECERWLAALPEGAEHAEIRAILGNPARLEGLLLRRQMGVLEPLRTLLPEAWKELILLSSERQLATIMLLRRWLPEIPEATLQEFGVTRPELELLLETGASIGKYFDHAFLKQMEIADLPGGSAPTKLGREGSTGAKYLYDPYIATDSDDIRPQTFSQVFPFEWPRIRKHFERLAEVTERMIAAGKLPEEKYRRLPAYFRLLAEAYGSPLTDPAEIAALWKEAYQAGAELLLGGCPLAIVAQAVPTVAGDANKVDVELRLGLVDTRMKEYAQRIQPTHDVGQQVLDTLLARNPNLVQDHRTISPTLLASHLLGFGPNLYWRVDAEQRQGHVLIHPDAVREAAVKDLTQLRKVFGIDLSDAAYAKAAVTELDAHETGHMIMGWMDSKVAGRIGLHEQREAWILEELKAETVASNLIEQRLKRGDDLDPLAQFAAKLSSVLYYATGKSPEGSGERYYYTGLAELAALLEGGVLVPSGKGYRVTDPRRGIQILAGKGEEILQRFHANPSCTPGDVRAFVAPLKGRVTADARVQAFLKTARGA